METSGKIAEPRVHRGGTDPLLILIILIICFIILGVKSMVAPTSHQIP
jgi:hypothetical protein